jgi:hypothetical protein
MNAAEPARKRFDLIGWALDERLRRLLAAAEARVLGRGGVTAVAAVTGVSPRAGQEPDALLRTADHPEPVRGMVPVAGVGADRPEGLDADGVVRFVGRGGGGASNSGAEEAEARVSGKP